MVKALARSLIAILGGDVLLRKGAHFEHSYNHWHSDKQAGEDWTEFVTRSHREALDYVTHFPEPSGIAVVYAFVFSAGRSPDPGV